MKQKKVERHEFQAEVRQVLDIVINSLYTDKEIFIRELVSNASDALEKLRHSKLTDEDAEIHDSNLELEINISTDDQAHTFTIQDFGIGMNREEIIENIGTIAHSGSRSFIRALKEAGGQNQNLIGQFGVGFYSVFMVAEEVRVYSRSAKPGDSGWLWTCDGTGSYTLEQAEGLRRGTKIVAKLKEDCREFSQNSKVKIILERFSSYLDFPINLNGEKVNTRQAIWLKPKAEVKEDDYKEFYKYQAHAFDEPLDWMHFSADAPLAINALLFIPGSNPEIPGMNRVDPAVALHCRKVLIDPHPEKLLPEWLRFLKGVIDSADLPLNISRESMQDSALLQKIGNLICKRFLKHLEAVAKKDTEKYQRFWNQFSHYIKEGVISDFGHREALAPLLRFESTMAESGSLCSLREYTDRMKDGQKEIYYLSGPNRTAIEAGPYLEAFRARGLEVLFCFDSIDDYVLSHLREFDGKVIRSADQDDIELGESDTLQDSESMDKATLDKLCDWLQQILGEDKVKRVQSGQRLVDSPVAALNADKMMSPSMRRLMQSMGGQGGESIPLQVKLEINPRHPLINNLAKLSVAKPDDAKLIAEQLYDNALIAAGLLDDPRSMVKRMESILERLSMAGES